MRNTEVIHNDLLSLCSDTKLLEMLKCHIWRKVNIWHVNYARATTYISTHERIYIEFFYGCVCICTIYIFHLQQERQTFLKNKKWNDISSPNRETVYQRLLSDACYFVKMLLGDFMAFRWRHNDHDGVSNHQPHDCLLNRLFRRRSKKTSKLRVTSLCAGIHRSPVNSPHKWPVTRKMFPFEDVIMWNDQKE